ncbi:MAG: cation transporter [Acidobacteria bacterium]|nr:MAG: cation transporter [Acidobacteriota bacterium]
MGGRRAADGRGEVPVPDCCDDAVCEVEKLRTRQISTLRIVFGINAVMFVAELATGVLAGSVSLVSDSLDMLGDALAYGLSLYVVRRSAQWKARSAAVKGGIMAAFGLAALGQAAYKAWVPHPPGFAAMGLMGTAALAANATCLGLLWRHRSDDINMQSVWICSRNDIVANLSVIVAAGLVWFWRTGWPDTIIGVALAVFVLRSALRVLRRARTELRAPAVAPQASRP